jgi:hypothetical protein
MYLREPAFDMREARLGWGCGTSRTAAGPFGEATAGARIPPELARLRLALLSRLTPFDLSWIAVPLRGGFTINVCSPVRVRVNAQDLQPVAKYLDGSVPDGPFYLYPPVNANETYRLALQWNVFPLTRAVFDQAFNVSVYVRRVPWPPQTDARRMYDFVGYSQKLHRQLDYLLHHGVRMVAGAHKLWVLSARGPTVNHGFHALINECAKAINTCVPGPLLDKRFAAIQDLGTRHDASHWDYSQLLQFMTDLRDSSGRSVDLRGALLSGNPAVWDEQPAMLPEARLPSAAKGARAAARVPRLGSGNYEIANSARNYYVK